MADISITQTHQLSYSDAKAAAQQVADQMSREYDMTSQWVGDVLMFKRSGVSGSLTLAEREAQLDISLGFFFKTFAPTIREKVALKMKKVFDSNV